MTNIRERLLSLQSTYELARKAGKATRKGHHNVEEHWNYLSRRRAEIKEEYSYVPPRHLLTISLPGPHGEVQEIDHVFKYLGSRPMSPETWRWANTPVRKGAWEQGARYE